MTKAITKSVIPAAGFGTRMLPAAKAVPKELLPILDRPTIQYIVEEAAEAGVRDVALITSKGKGAIEEHFRPNERLSERLRAAGKESLLGSIDALMARVKITAIDQPAQRGLGDAVRQAREWVGDEAFLCQLGDAIFSGDTQPATQMIEAYRSLGTSVIGLEEVPAEKVDRYGIVGGQMVGEGVLKVDTLIEKPARDQAPSRYAIAARYILTPRIFDCLDRTTPGSGGEIQLTDAMKLLLKEEAIHGVVLKARRHDIGNPIDWVKTNLIFAKRDPRIWKEIAPLIEELMR